MKFFTFIFTFILLISLLLLPLSVYAGYFGSDGKWITGSAWSPSFSDTTYYNLDNGSSFSTWSPSFSDTTYFSGDVTGSAWSPSFSDTTYYDLYLPSYSNSYNSYLDEFDVSDNFDSLIDTYNYGSTYEPPTYEPYKYEPPTYEPYKYEPPTYEPYEYEPYEYEPYEPPVYEPYDYDSTYDTYDFSY